MPGWAFVFFLLALAAAYVGFPGLAGVIAKPVLLVFLVLLVVSAPAGLLYRHPPREPSR